MAAPADQGALLSDDELAAWKGMLRTHADLVALLDAELRSEHDLPLTSYEVLMILSDAPGGKLRMGDVANEILLSRSGLTRLVDRLEQQGFSGREPCPDDARGMFAVITPAGRRLVKAARATHLAGVRRHFLSRLEPRQLDSLAEVWRRVGSGG